MSRILDSRVVLATRIVRRDRLNGTWWPRTSDIETELAPLLAHTRTRGHTALGISLNRDDWPDAPIIIQPGLTRSPKISWYGLPEPHLAILHVRGPARITLLLLPPNTPDEVAVTAMLMTTTPGNCLSTTQTLARAYDRAARHSATT